MASQEYAEPEYAKKQDRAKVPFYHVNIEHKIPEERDAAFDIRAYPCTGLGSWLVPQLRRLPAYPEILERAKHGKTVRDVGTFIGHDLRRLVYDGAPSGNLYGVDIISHFNVGFDFFRDRQQFQGHFIEADFLSDGSSELQALKGKVDIVIVSQLLHQWNWVGQVKAAKVLTTFRTPGSLIVGNQIGNLQEQDLFMRSLEANVYRHHPESWAKMWAEVGEVNGTRWETEAWLRSFPDMGWDSGDAAWMEPGVRLMEFVVRRIV